MTQKRTVNTILVSAIAMFIGHGALNAQDTNNTVEALVVEPAQVVQPVVIEEPKVDEVEYNKEKLQYFLTTVGRRLAAEPIVSGAIARQNKEYASLRIQDIIELDKKWRNGDTALMAKSKNSPLSSRLKDYLEKYNGIFTEIFVMDQYGLNVGQTHGTSDYWQGDEDKFQKVYRQGPNAVNIEPAEYDDSMGMIQVMTSLPVMHYATGEVVGAIAFAINPDRIP